MTVLRIGVEVAMTRRFTLLFCASITACADVGVDLDSGPPDDAGESSAVATLDGGDDADAADDGGAEADDVGEATGGTTAGSGGGSEGSDDGDDTDTPESTACMPVVVFDALQQHVHDLRTASALLSGHPLEGEAAGFLLAPGLPMPPALPIASTGTMPCTDAVTMAPLCDLGSCVQLECTGLGGGWRLNLWIDPGVQSDGWSIEHARVAVEWVDGTMTTPFRITTRALTPGRADISMTGEGEMQRDGFFVVETFPALFEPGPATVAYAWGPGGYAGSIRIGEVVVAHVDATGDLQPTGDCP